MTATSTSPRIRRDSSREHLTGTGTLVRFMLRRDRIKLLSWGGGFLLFLMYLQAALPMVAETEAELATTTQLFGDPIGRLLTGPGYGFDDPTFASFIAGGYGLYLLVLAALMSILLISRHTRVEEQTGRAELVRANVVGRHAQLTAALIVAVITNLLVTVVVFGMMVGPGGYEATGSLLLALGIGLAGMTFAGVTTITVQLTEYSRAASGMAGAVLAAAFVVRAGGDMVAAGGSLVSWLSPLAWPQQTGPFVLDRWWPLLLNVAVTLVAIAVGFWLSAGRDLGASWMTVKPGPAEGHPALGTPLGLAFRLQRASIIGWGASLTVGAVMFGAYAHALIDAADDLPDIFQELFGVQQLLMGYLGFMAVYMAYFVSAYVIMAVQGWRAEETSGRLEPVLATPVSRSVWLGANLAVTTMAAVGILLLTGVGLGVGVALVTSDASLIGELVIAHINHAPAILVTLGIATLFLGVLPRAIPATWVVLGYALFIGTFGSLMQLPQAAHNLSPFSHLAEMPQEDFVFAPVPILLIIAASAAVIGLAGLRRRDLDLT